MLAHTRPTSIYHNFWPRANANARIAALKRACYELLGIMLSLPQLIPSKIGHILEVSVTKNIERRVFFSSSSSFSAFDWGTRLSKFAPLREFDIDFGHGHISGSRSKGQCTFPTEDKFQYWFKFESHLCRFTTYETAQISQIHKSKYVNANDIPWCYCTGAAEWSVKV